MLALAALLAGPQWRSPRVAGRGSLWAALPLLALAVADLAAWLAGLLWQPPGGIVQSVLHTAVLAGEAVALSLLLAIPASLVRPGPGWLIAASLALTLGAAGWSVMALPTTAFGASLPIAVLILPVMVLGLGAAWSRMPAGIWENAASLGARSPAIIMAVLAAAWPAILRSCLVAVLVAVLVSQV